MNQPHSTFQGERPELTVSLTDNTDEQISIIVVHRNRPQYLNICLQSIAATSANNNYEIIVVDNGSDDESQTFLDSIKDEVKVVKNKENMYWSAAANKGVEMADKASKYYVFMHCDTVVLNPSWLDLLVNISEGRSSGLVGCSLQSYYLQGQKVDFIEEWCVLITKECWKDIGPFPVELPQIGNAFIMTIRSQTRGWEPQFTQNSIVHHYRNFSLDVSEYERLQEDAVAQMPKLLREAQKLSRRV